MKKLKLQESDLVASKASWKKSIPYLLLVLPAALYLLVFHYLPIFGVVVAFKDYNYVDGILGSPCAGFKYFDYFFTSNDAFRVLRNTMGYSLMFHFVGIFTGVLLAILLYEVTSPKLLRVYHTGLLMPYFISWVVGSYVFYILLSHSSGIVNQILITLGAKPVNWYQEPKYWPFILQCADIWKNVGMGCVLYYANLMSLDASLFEAASIDGANRFQQWIKIGIPSLIPLICIITIMKMGSILGGDFGLFYQVPMDSGPLYPVTDTVQTYLYRGLVAGDMSVSAAVGLVCNVVGLVMVLGSNAVVRKLDPDSAMF